jgi:hypothetical protein
LKGYGLKAAMNQGSGYSRDPIAGAERSGILPEWAPHPEPLVYTATPDRIFIPLVTFAKAAKATLALNWALCFWRFLLISDPPFGA